MGMGFESKQWNENGAPRRSVLQPSRLCPELFSRSSLLPKHAIPWCQQECHHGEEMVEEAIPHSELSLPLSVYRHRYSHILVQRVSGEGSIDYYAIYRSRPDLILQMKPFTGRSIQLPSGLQ